MNRFDRLLAIFIHLQSKKFVTAKELAQRFEVSIRTIYRDIRSLENAGIPLGSETNKGYFIVEGYRLPPAMFNPEEIGALLLAEKAAGLFTDKKTEGNLVSAVTKIKAILKGKDQERASVIEEKITTFNNQEEEPYKRNDFLYKLQTALYERRVVEIQYDIPQGNRLTQRKVEPLSLFFSDYHWYLVAFCQLRSAYRIFRVDRIQDLHTIDDNFPDTHPPINEVMKMMLNSKPLHLVKLRIQNDPASEQIMNKLIPGLIKEEAIDDKIEISVMTDSLPVLGRWLLESPGKVEIIQPAELKKIVHQYALEAAQHYLERA